MNCNEVWHLRHISHQRQALGVSREGLDSSRHVCTQSCLAMESPMIAIRFPLTALRSIAPRLDCGSRRWQEMAHGQAAAMAS